MNVRTCRAHIAKLATALGSGSRAQLGYLIAESGILKQEGAAAYRRPAPGPRRGRTVRGGIGAVRTAACVQGAYAARTPPKRPASSTSDWCTRPSRI